MLLADGYTLSFVKSKVVELIHDVGAFEGEIMDRSEAQDAGDVPALPQAAAGAKARLFFEG